MGSSAKDIDNLSPQKRALLDLLLRKKNVDLAGVRLIPQKRAISRLSRKKNSSLFPLSFAQQRLWLIDQLEPGSNAYNVAAAYRIKGLLNRPILEKSLNEILRRHEVLRATFSTVDGQPCQDINAFEFRSLNTRDISDLPEDEREDRARQLATIEARQPFDLAQRPLFRMKLLRLAENDHVMLLTMHHIVSDGWSIDILHRELSTLYQAFSTGKPSPLPELAIQYTDFAAWQRQERRIFCFFDNDQAGYAAQDALRLQKMIQGK